MTEWVQFLRKETPEAVFDYLPAMLENLTIRVRNGRTSLQAEGLTKGKQAQYQAAVDRLTIERDFFAAMLRYRDVELPALLGSNWDAENHSEEVIFQRNADWVHCLQATDAILQPDHEADLAELQEAINRVYKTKEGESLTKNAFDVFSSEGYDYQDLPIFYRDICCALNAIGTFQIKVWDDLFAARRKKKNTK